MAKGATPTQSTTYTPPKEVTEMLGLAMPGIRQYAASTPQQYGGTSVAPFNENQVSGQNQALDAGVQQNILASQAGTGLGKYFTDLWNPESNANLQGTIRAATRPITDSLMQDTLPAIRNDFGGQNFGSSRRAIAEGVATGKAAQAVGDTANKVVTDLYKTNTDAGLKGIALTPTVQGAQTAGAGTTSAVGDVQQNMTQSLINDLMQRFNFSQMAPFLQSKDIMSLLGTVPGGTTTSTGNNPSTPGVGSALSGAASGATLGSMLMPGVGTAAGAVAGGVLPFLFR